MTFVEYLVRQIEFSARTFGPGPRTNGVVDHIRREISELLDESPETRHEEWVDVAILALDGLWRSVAHESGEFGPDEIILTSSVALRVEAEIEKKLRLNESRQWPDWRTAAPDRAIEHVREND